MDKPILVIMAAGLGSRYGGLKQIDPVDEQGHIIIDFSIYDALQAGFEEVVCIIKPELEADFHEAIGKRIAPFIKLRYAYQELGRLPEGFSIPEGRQKPWGTAHAVLCAKEQIHSSFCVINADDFYGRTAFESIYRFLTANVSESEHAMVGYRIENTLTEFGQVARGICSVNERGELTEVTERTAISPADGGAVFTENGRQTFVPNGTQVSMNLWGFHHSMLREIEARFPDWLKTNVPLNPLKCEYFLPLIPSMLIHEGKARIHVLPTQERWYGVTYHEDMKGVRESIAKMKASGLYPDELWR